MTRVAPLAVPVLLAGALFASQPASAQVSAADLLVRIDQLENQVRQLTGTVEQLQFRNQQLETMVRRTQEENEFRFQELGGKGGARPAAPPQRQGTSQPMPAPQPMAQPAPPQPSYVPPQQPALAPAPQQMPARRGDVFDPGQAPGAPGAPRPLGSLYSSAPEPPPGEPVGVPGGRQAGAPLDLSTMSAAAVNDPSLAPRSSSENGLPPPPPRNPNATGAQYATLPPTQSPRDEYDLAYGYLLRKEYAQAEETFRVFLKKYPGNRLEPEAQYWLGESLFQRQNYRDAAEAFLALSKKYESSPKAPEALLRLGQSLAGMQQKELACATFGEIGRKYPRAGPTIKQTVDREQKRVHC